MGLGNSLLLGSILLLLLSLVHCQSDEGENKENENDQTKAKPMEGRKNVYIGGYFDRV